MLVAWFLAALATPAPAPVLTFAPASSPLAIIGRVESLIERDYV
jgi:hypothetical protein